jgi:serine/threonine protein kinase
MTRLDHPNCAMVWEVLEVRGSVYVAREYVDGAALRDVVKKAGSLSNEQALGVARAVLSGLAHAHNLGLTHRNLTPQNVIADLEGTPKLVDFGERQAAGATNGNETTADVQAAGALLAGLAPGRTGRGRGPVRGVAEPIQQLIATATSAGPGPGFESAVEFLTALEAAAVEAYGPSWETAASIRDEVEPAAVSRVTRGATATASGRAATKPRAGATPQRRTKAPTPPSYARSAPGTSARGAAGAISPSPAAQRTGTAERSAAEPEGFGARPWVAGVSLAAVGALGGATAGILGAPQPAAELPIDVAVAVVGAALTGAALIVGSRTAR